jgi:hypothetical protein
MNEATGTKLADFGAVSRQVCSVMEELARRAAQGR